MKGSGCRKMSQYQPTRFPRYPGDCLTNPACLLSALLPLCLQPVNTLPSDSRIGWGWEMCHNPDTWPWYSSAGSGGASDTGPSCPCHVDAFIKPKSPSFQQRGTQKWLCPQEKGRQGGHRTGVQVEEEEEEGAQHTGKWNFLVEVPLPGFWLACYPFPQLRARFQPASCKAAAERLKPLSHPCPGNL